MKFKTIYKTVYDLNRDELNELKNSFYWQDETQDILENAFTSQEEIPDYIIFEHYDGLCFVDDDFYCNVNSNEMKGE